MLGVYIYKYITRPSNHRQNNRGVNKIGATHPMEDKPSVNKK